jgi:RNA polymerase sigma-70 factor (ECF subfamily)
MSPFEASEVPDADGGEGARAEPSLTERPDDTFDLVRRYQGGESQAGEELANRYYPRILRIVRVRLWSRLRGWTSPEDVVTEVFVRILGSLPRFEQRGTARFIDWVAKLIEHEIVNQARKQRGTPPTAHTSSTDLEAERQLMSHSKSVSSKLASTEEQRLVDECLTELPASERDVIMLREYAGASWEDVAAELGRPTIAAAQQLYQRARRALGDRLRLRGVS